jgi:16S rRNA pseudouridine516 synthase
LSKPVRLDRLLANNGFGSRTEVTIKLSRGQVHLEGTMIRDGATKVFPEQFELVTVDGEPLDHPHGVSVLFHKPTGYSCSHDESEAPIVDRLLPEEWALRNPRPEWAGRLDRDTSGLLFITDDHQLLHRLTSPKHHVEKRYEVTLGGSLPSVDAAIAQFASGELMLQNDKKPCLPATLIPTDDAFQFVVLIREGRYHQVRNMMAAVGGHVRRLHRTNFGDLELGKIPEGEFVYL